jgi:hypothetical protein
MLMLLKVDLSQPAGDNRERFPLLPVEGSFTTLAKGK